MGFSTAEGIVEFTWYEIALMQKEGAK